MKRLIALLLVLASLLACMSGCMASKPVETLPNKPTNQDGSETQKPTNPVGDVDEPIDETIETLGFTEFDSALIEYLNQKKQTENYMFSPISLKMAVALAASGADGETLDEILAAMGYESLDEYLNWAQAILAFEETYAEDDVDAGNGEIFVESIGTDKSKFSIANGVWHNTDKPGVFTDIYKDNVARMQAMFKEIPGDQMHTSINEWVNEETRGLIPSLFNEPLNDYNNILINTVYLKSAWMNSFNKNKTEDGEFTTIDGDAVMKQMMKTIDHYNYYEDENCQVLIMPMYDGFRMAVVLGDASDIMTKIQNANGVKVDVTIPKFEIDSMFDSDIIEFLNQRGMISAFNENTANFGNMMDVNTYVDAVMQKTKLKVDEEGLEAAAVTSMAMGTTSAPMPEKIYQFIADEPFSFYIYAENQDMLENPELLFFGQYVR